MSNNPYKIEPPFYVSFSGGRTSGYLLRQVLDAWGGTLPEGGHVLFANTGREYEATLEFIREVQSQWCPVTWLEWRDAERPFEVVTFDTASRNGEPFAAIIRKRKFLPNPVARFCTSDLKVKTMHRYLLSIGLPAPPNIAEILGLRYDEIHRVMKLRNDEQRDIATPMADAKVTRKMVESWWALQDFDLRLPENDNAWCNCDLCFLKARDKIDRIMLADPKRADWWAQMEEEIGGTFRKDRPSYKNLLTQVTLQGRLFQDMDDDTIPCDCTE